MRESTSSEAIEVQVKFAPADSDPRPRMIDLRVRPSRPVQLLWRAGGMLQAEMTFHHDAANNESWKRRTDGSYQVLIGGLGDARRLEVGLLATLRFERDSGNSLSFALEKRAQTFAPLSADAALQAAPFGHATVAR